MIYWLIALAVWLGLNVAATRRVRRSLEPRFKQNMLIMMVWLVPFLGLFHTVQLHMPEGTPPAPGQPLPVRPGNDAPSLINVPGIPMFDLDAHVQPVNGFPLPDWGAVQQWAALGDADSAIRARQAAACAWLTQMSQVFDPPLWVHEDDQSMLLSHVENNEAQATGRFISKTRTRIQNLLRDVAQFPAGEKTILLVMPSLDAYYQYIACYYPDEGEFASSGGMFIDAGRPHFVVPFDHLSNIEPVIAHELSHAAVAHLKLPRWLDEGLAVNVEQRLTGVPKLIYTGRELREKHLRYWNEVTIQKFWSGAAFFNTDDGNLLSYDLARILVEFLAKDWAAFLHLLTQASREDAGQAAIRTVNTRLGMLVAAFLEAPESEPWEPDPAQWTVAQARAPSTPAASGKV